MENITEKRIITENITNNILEIFFLFEKIINITNKNIDQAI